MFKLALDAGHGLFTEGKRVLRSLDAAQTAEWWLNDRIADDVEKQLQAYGDVAVKRCDDTTGKIDVPLSTRVQTANAFGAELFISIHHNAGINGGTGGGIVVYRHPDAGEKAKAFQALVYQKLTAATGLKGNRSQPLATGNFQVIRQTTMPGVLLELGFMDSKTDVPILLTAAYAGQCAAAIVSAVRSYAGLPAAETAALYETLADLPVWGKATVEKLIKKGYLKGIGDGSLAISGDLLRLLVIHDRAGLYDHKAAAP